MTVRSVSTLTPVKELTKEAIFAARNDCIAKTEALARDRYPTLGLYTRDLLPNDITSTDVGTTVGEWIETSGGDNAYANTSIDGTSSFAIANQRFVGIWGVRLYTVVSVTPIVVEWRVSVGGAVVAKWNLYPLWQIQDPDNGEVVVFYPLAGIVRDPIIIPEDITIKIEEYTNVATTVYRIALEGCTVEPVNKVIGV